MKENASIADYLRSDRTPAGRSVSAWIDDQAREQNYAYRTVEDLFERIRGQAFDLHPIDEKEDAIIEQVVKSLRTNVDNLIHYQKRLGGGKPGMFGINGEQLFVDPQRGYLYLVFHYEDNDDGLAGFLRDCDMPPSTSLKVLMGCAALLDLDTAFEQIEKDQPWRVTWTIYGIAEAAQEIQEIIIDEHFRAERSKKASDAGKAAHKDTNEYKERVLQAWSKGGFKNAAACARWACREFPIQAIETPLRWIREFKKINTCLS